MLHILKLDSLGPEIAASGNDYESVYARLVRGGGYDGPLAHYETRYADEYPDVGDGDAVLLGGSRLDAFASDAFTLKLVAFVRDLLARPSIKLVGVCYGHQIIARALGAPVERAVWEVGVVPLELTPEGQKVFKELSQGDGLQQSHLDQVTSLPRGATLLATTRDCPIQAFGWAQRALCVQGHPEFSAELSHVCLDRIAEKDLAAAARGRLTVDDPQAGPKFGHAFARLIMNNL